MVDAHGNPGGNRSHGPDRCGRVQGSPGRVGGLGCVPDQRHQHDDDHDADDFGVVGEQRDDHPSHDHDHDAGRHFGGFVTVTDTMTAAHPSFVERSFRAIGTTATVVIPEGVDADLAQSILRDEIAAIDLACSRFRPDSEIEWLHRQSGRTVVVSHLLFEALDVAMAVAERTHGAVDPTVGNAMSTLGYDRDFEHVGNRPLPPPSALGPVVGFGHVHLCARTREVRIPRGFDSTWAPRPRRSWLTAPPPVSPPSWVRVSW